MITTPLATLLSFSLLVFTGQAADTSTPTATEQVQNAERPGRELRRGDWRERRERARSASPEERAQMRLEGMVRMTSRLYELDDAQTDRVREEILRMQTERELAMGADAVEYQNLREQMAEFWSRQDQGAETDEARADENRRERWRGLRDDPEFQKIREGLRSIEEKYPFDFEAAARRVEAILPAEQAARGRERREERLANWRDRRERREGENNGEERRRGERRMERRRGQTAASGDAVTAPDAARQSITPQVLRQPVAPVQPPPAAPRPLHPWETHVRQFIAQHELTEAQTTSAMAILRDVQNRAAQIESAQSDHRAEAAKIPDPTARQKRMVELNAPVDQLFIELKQRLDGLLTAAQRQKVGK